MAGVIYFSEDYKGSSTVGCIIKKFKENTVSRYFGKNWHRKYLCIDTNKLIFYYKDPKADTSESNSHLFQLSVD